METIVALFGDPVVYSIVIAIVAIGFFGIGYSTPEGRFWEISDFFYYTGILVGLSLWISAFAPNNKVFVLNVLARQEGKFYSAMATPDPRSEVPIDDLLASVSNYFQDHFNFLSESCNNGVRQSCDLIDRIQEKEARLKEMSHWRYARSDTSSRSFFTMEKDVEVDHENVCWGYFNIQQLYSGEYLEQRLDTRFNDLLDTDFDSAFFQYAAENPNEHQVCKNFNQRLMEFRYQEKSAQERLAYINEEILIAQNEDAYRFQEFLIEKWSRISLVGQYLLALGLCVKIGKSATAFKKKESKE